MPFFFSQYNGTDFLTDLQMPILAFVSLLLTLAIYFYLGQRFHSNLIDLSDAIYDTEWQQYPRSIQRFVQLMMMRSQRPFYLSAYGLLELNLENFVGVSEGDIVIDFDKE